jgi:hypothetical protein
MTTVKSDQNLHQFDTSGYIIDKTGDGARYSLERIEAIKREAYNQAINDVISIYVL